MIMVQSESRSEMLLSSALQAHQLLLKSLRDWIPSGAIDTIPVTAPAREQCDDIETLRAAIKDMYNQKGADRLPSKELASLHHPALAACQTLLAKQKMLAELIKPIRPQPLHIGKRRARGYYRWQFEQ
jgi:hypothetical protein